MELNKLIIDKLDKIQDDVTDLKVTNAKQSKDISQNTKDLSEHIEGVKQTRTLIASQDKRIAKLEEPRKVINYITKGLLWFGGIAGAIVTASKLFEYIK